MTAVSTAVCAIAMTEIAIAMAVLAIMTANSAVAMAVSPVATAETGRNGRYDDQTTIAMAETVVAMAESSSLPFSAAYGDMGIQCHVPGHPACLPDCRSSAEDCEFEDLFVHGHRFSFSNWS